MTRFVGAAIALWVVGSAADAGAQSLFTSPWGHFPAPTREVSVTFSAIDSTGEVSTKALTGTYTRNLVDSFAVEIELDVPVSQHQLVGMARLQARVQLPDRPGYITIGVVHGIGVREGEGIPRGAGFAVGGGFLVPVTHRGAVRCDLSAGLFAGAVTARAAIGLTVGFR